MKYIEQKIEPTLYSDFIRKKRPKEWSDLSKKIGKELREFSTLIKSYIKNNL